MLEWLGMPVAASAHAGEVDRIMVLVHWLMLVLFVGWSIFFVYVLVRFRRGAQPDRPAITACAGRWSDVDRGRRAGRRDRPAGVLLDPLLERATSMRSRRTGRPPSCASSPSSSRGTSTIPGADGEFGRTDITLVRPDNPLGLDRNDPAAKDDITTINQLNLPVASRPVIVHLSSKDVVHSFGLPQMRVKQDAIPGIVQPVWFTPTQTGHWDIACSQLCGLGHYRMKAFYAIQTQDAFDAWLKEEAEFLENP